jgi:uncharacterized protein YlxW (UPF0749 family)
MLSFLYSYSCQCECRITTVKGSVERQAAASLEAVRSLEARIAEVDESLNMERSQWQDRVANIEKSVDRRLADTESKNCEIESRLAQVEKVILNANSNLFTEGVCICNKRACK